MAPRATRLLSALFLAAACGRAAAQKAFFVCNMISAPS
jgi:hypothetical protein